MDIQIKYKEVDRIKPITKLLCEQYRYYHQGKVLDFKATAEEVGCIYKEESKEIESVTIKSPFESDRHIFQATITKGKNRDSIYISIPVLWKTDKSTLGEVINILTKIHDQME
jgi:hypothetical protein